MIKKHDNQSSRIKLPLTTTRGGSTNQERPIFSLTYLQGKYDLTHCNQEQKAEFANTIFHLSKLTWNEIQMSHRHGLGVGVEIIHKKSIKTTIPGCITDDVRILAFRCHGFAPMIGYRDGVIFYVIWLDPKLSVYDH